MKELIRGKGGAEGGREGRKEKNQDDLTVKEKNPTNKI